MLMWRRKKTEVSDEDIIELFNDLGLPSNLAKTMMYISDVEECCSEDIESSIDLQQPEVSVAMQELRKRGWISKKKLKNKHRYTKFFKLKDMDEDYQEQYNVFVYDMIRYSPNEKPHKTIY